MSENKKQLSRKRNGNKNTIVKGIWTVAVILYAVFTLVFFVVVSFQIKKTEKRIQSVQKDMNAIQENMLHEDETNIAKEDLEKGEESKYDILPEKNTYLDGFLAGKDYLSLREDIVALYKANAITYEQLEKYVEKNLYLLNLSCSKDEISCMDIKNYNKIIEEIDLVNYDKYYLGTTEEFLSGFKDSIKYNAYYQMVSYYHDSDQIPNKKYKAFEAIISANNVIKQKNVMKIINYARDIIKDCIGNPDDVILSKEWRKYSTVKDFLTMS